MIVNLKFVDSSLSIDEVVARVADGTSEGMVDFRVMRMKGLMGFATRTLAV